MKIINQKVKNILTQNKGYIFILLGIMGLFYIALLLIFNNKTMEKKINLNNQNLEKATFAGGCFWCMEAVFQKMEGVEEVVSGYSGGEKKNPTYQEVSSGETEHRESIQVHYNPDIVNYKTLLNLFWRQINPTDSQGQFVDRGKQYTSAIFYHNTEQKELALKSKKDLQMSKRFKADIVTEILPYDEFYKAEEYHQDYYKNHSLKYNFYRYGSGRDQFLKKKWGENSKVKNVEKLSKQRQKVNLKDWNNFSKPSSEELKKKLTPLQYRVTQKEATEPPFKNEYWDNKKEGIYVDIVSGEPLFSSKDMYESGTGWPSFTKPLEQENILEKEDKNFFVTRTEVRSKHANSHLGHVFKDGPDPTGLRYCLNSAALRFILKEDLKKEGYDKYVEMYN